MISTTLHNNKQRTVTLEFKDNRDRPAAVENLSITSENEDGLLVIDPALSEDGTTATFTARARGPVGPFSVHITADGQVGEGEAPIAQIITFEVHPANASTIGAVFGDEQDIPE